MSKKPFWSGIFPAVTTQFSKEGALDLAATQTEVDALLKAGVHGHRRGTTNCKWFEVNSAIRHIGITPQANWAFGG